MDHTFTVTVVDDAAKPANLTGARVSLVEKKQLGLARHPFPGLDTTHTDAGNGTYTEAPKIVPTAGDWMLVVTLDGKAPVVQPLQLKSGKGGEFIAVPQPGRVATVTITATAVPSKKRKEIAFHVTLHPAAELVFIAGVDYHQKLHVEVGPDPGGGNLFHEYAFDRAKILHIEKKIHDGTIVTVFSTARIWRTTRVWGDGKWVDIEVDHLGDPSKRKPVKKNELYRPLAGLDINIIRFYEHISDVGKRAPKSVKEIGIFSHSEPGGPILYNTGESKDRKGNDKLRDPNDFDARPKDFNDLNFAGYDRMTDAFAPDCRFSIWGCSATTHYKMASREALHAIKKGLPEDAFFTVRSDIEDENNPAAGVVRKEQEGTSELRHRFQMDLEFRGGTYAAEAAKKLGIEVRAACPGTGSDVAPVNGFQVFMVDVKLYKDVFDYFHEKFAPQFAETKGTWDQGYVDYHALQSRKAVGFPKFSTEYYDLVTQTKVTRWHKTTGANITFWNGVKVEHPTPNFELVINPMADFVTKGKKGHLYILQDKDKTKSQAAFVQEDERVFQITKDAKGEWTVQGSELHYVPKGP